MLSPIEWTQIILVTIIVVSVFATIIYALIDDL